MDRETFIKNVEAFLGIKLDPFRQSILLESATFKELFRSTPPMIKAEEYTDLELELANRSPFSISEIHHAFKMVKKNPAAIISAVKTAMEANFSGGERHTPAEVILLSLPTRKWPKHGSIIMEEWKFPEYESSEP